MEKTPVAIAAIVGENTIANVDEVPLQLR